MTRKEESVSGTSRKLPEGRRLRAISHRARNPHRAAELVARENGGRLPEDPEALAALPGIGRSTAGAIAAIAFRRDAPILDANAKRVIARLFAVSEPLSRPSVERRLVDLSRGLIEPGKGRETALALTDP